MVSLIVHACKHVFVYFVIDPCPLNFGNLSIGVVVIQLSSHTHCGYFRGIVINFNYVISDKAYYFHFNL